MLEKNAIKAYSDSNCINITSNLLWLLCNIISICSCSLDICYRPIKITYISFFNNMHEENGW